MKCGYRGWIIDATPDFSLGKFFAHARLVRVSSDLDVDSEMHIERDLSYFDTEDEAIEVAHNGRSHGSASATARAIVCRARRQHPGVALRSKRHPAEMPDTPRSYRIIRLTGSDTDVRIDLDISAHSTGWPASGSTTCVVPGTW